MKRTMSVMEVSPLERKRATCRMSMTLTFQSEAHLESVLNHVGCIHIILRDTHGTRHQFA